MTPYNRALHALGVPGGLTLEGDGVYEMLYLRDAYVVDVSDTGHEFESHLGANISHREVVDCNWANRVFSGVNKTVTDPNNGDTVTKKVLVKVGNGVGGVGGGGAAATNRLIAYQLLSQPVTWDGTNDQQNFNASGIFRLGGA